MHQTLGDALVPINYDLTLEPDFKTFHFKGRVVIRGNAKKGTGTIKLNVKELSIKKVTVMDGKEEQVPNFSVDEGEQILTLKLKRKVFGYVEVAIDYVGVNNDKLYGFYRSKYTHNGRDKYILTTQFEAPNARAAFPCIDEPAAKATFDVSLIIDKDMDGISNMPVSDTRKAGRKKQLIFGTTPKMSAYLLYLGVGKFDVNQGKAGHVLLRVLATEGKKKQTKIAFEYGKALLAAQERYFKIRFPLPKLDLIAVPDFSAGAMENWGAITFRETALLGEEGKTAVSSKQVIAEVISHELVHQWFGDLVTMKWWDDIWLNESFATFMAYKIVDEVVPEWKFMLTYHDDTVSDALALDALKSTHPVNVPVSTPGEIGSVFDMISYHKGGSVLWMLEDYVGNEIFREGLHIYLKENSYSNATKFDLWNSIQKAAALEKQKLPVAKVLGGWIDQPGYPVVDVKRSNGGFILEQSRYTLLNDKSKLLWKIPIKYKTERGEGKLLMESKKETLKINSKWIKLNFGQKGFYRVNYDDDQLTVLGQEIKEKKIGAVDAVGIENDLFALARSGRVPVSRYLAFVNRYLMDAEYPMNISISGHLNWIITIGEGRSFADDAKRTSIKFHNNLLIKLGWDIKKKEDSISTRLRAIAISGLGKAGHQPTIDKAYAMLNAFIQKKGELDVNIRSAVYAIAARYYGNENLFDTFLDLYRTQDLPADRARGLQSLGFFNDAVLLKKALDLALSKEVRLQDSTIILSTVAGNPRSHPIYFDWVKTNWKKLTELYDPAAHELDRAVSGLAGYSDEHSRDSIKEFFSHREHVRDDIKKSIAQALEYIQANINFLNVNR